MQKYSYIVEKYTDVHKTLEQAICINANQPDEYFHRERAFMRTQINPNLTWLYEIMYLNEARQPLYWEIYDIDGNFVKRDEPWFLENNKNKYSKGGEIL